MARIFILLAYLTMLIGCHQGPSAEEVLANAQALEPHDSVLNEIYQRSCRNCHTLESTGAPLTGDVNAWQARLDKGKDVLIENVVNGFGGMPPFGLCMDCNAEQFDALIDFMASQEN